MSRAAERLKARIAALEGTPPPKKIPSAGELLRFVLDHIDLECFLADGRARCVIDAPPELLDALMEWDSDEREIDEDFEGGLQ